MDMKEDEKRILKVVGKRKLSSSELETILKGTEQAAPQQKVTWEDYFGTRALFGVISDSHIGSNMFDYNFAEHVAKEFKKRKIKVVYHAGDILEGMSGRDGQVYELSEIGFENQMDKAVQVIGGLFGGMKVRGINGNHDLWYMKKNNGGVNVGRNLAERCKNFAYLGDMEANIKLHPKVSMKLFHANDGTAYATSYKLQKLIESFTGGEKPEVVFSGHYHKAMYMFCRNVHGFESGTLCGQTEWMRGKKIPAHKGAWIIDVEMGKGGIGRFGCEFIPGYK